MPKLRTKPLVPPEIIRARAKELCDLYGYSLGIGKVTEVLGSKDPRVAERFVQENGIQSVNVSGRRKWLASDIAKALELLKFQST